jgi:trigger factor
MNITVTDQEACRKQVRLEIPGDLVRTETNKVAADLARKVNIPGFRRGHVPSSVVKTRFRKELRDEVVSQLLPNALQDAIREKDLKVIGKPELDEINFSDDESINATFIVEVAPDFTLSNYKNIPLTKRVYNVTDEEVDKAIQAIREAHAELVPVEDRGAEQHDIVTSNIVGSFEPQESGSGELAAEVADRDEVESDQIKQEEVDIELEGEGVMKQFTDALTGGLPGETKRFTVEYPADYHSKRYAGRKVNYTVEIVTIRTKERPALDDEFAQTIGEEYKSLQDLRAGIRKRLEHEAENRTDEELSSATMEQLVDRNRFDVPDAVVERQIDARMNTVIGQMRRQGIDPRQLKVDWDALRESNRERATRDVRGSFIIDRIAQAESIEVNDEELAGEIERLALASGQTSDALRARLTKEGTLDSIKEQVRNRKALAFVKASADIRIEDVHGLGRNEPSGTG